MPSGVYVHVPWCRRRCTYCDFYFVVGAADPRFAEAVLREADARGPVAEVDTLYLGGGTPSALGVEGVRTVVAGLSERLTVRADAEITVELNPEDVDEALARGLVSAGVNRVSLGLQSFDDEVLRQLGRAHAGEAGADAVKRLVDAGISRVSVDLIVGVPGERPDRATAEVARAVALGAEHISSYLLTIEENTPWVKLMASGRRQDVDEDAQVDAYEAVRAACAGVGLRQYEISSFARPGAESRHNRIYWSQGAYLGLGPGAHSMRLVDDGGVERRQNARDLGAWLARPASADFEVERLAPRAAFLEAVAFGLRDLERGVDLGALAARHQVEDAPEVEAALLEQGERVERVGDRLRLTAAGALFADGVARAVLGL